ncbi:hypothetical protein ACOMHN_032629 [Nucella lapillus]
MIKVDHFGFENQQTFQQRYLVADQFWKDDGGPIFLYTGGQGDIAWLCTNTGFLWDIAPEFNALLVFAEHRYYGSSLPYGDDSYANASALNYLTVEQAMADFAYLIQHLRDTIPGATLSQLITIGGSYGGMLAAWMRLKYPNLVLGALSSSAPVRQFSGEAPCGSFYGTLDSTFLTASQQCVDNLADLCGQSGFPQSNLQSVPARGEQYDLSHMLDWLAVILGDLAMADYPYPAAYLQPLPAWPVKEFCKFLSEPLKGDNLTRAVSEGVKMYFNYTGQAKFIDMTRHTTKYRGEEGWHYQTCTEMVMPVCSNHSRIIFNIDWKFQKGVLAADCKSRWGVTPRDTWIPLTFWGRDLRSASNIIFSNGLLDPWSGGGVLESLSPSLVAITIPKAAQQIDLRAHNPADIPEVHAAREQERNIMKNWLKGQ